MEINRSGQVKSPAQIRQHRIRNGYCNTCRIDPVQCYQIKRFAFGLFSHRVPITVPGLVYNGICLKCRCGIDDHQICQTQRDNEIDRRDEGNGRQQLADSFVRMPGTRDFHDEEESIEQQTEEMDVLERCVAQYMERNQIIPTFAPGPAFIPNSELALEARVTEFSALTTPTVFRGNSQSVASNEQSQPAASSSSGLEPINELPDLESVRNVVNDYLQEEKDAEAIEAISYALSAAGSSDEDVVLFCLNTLWVLVRKSDKNKRNVLFGFYEDTPDDETPFSAIIGTMLAFEEKSKIQTTTCAVLWSLSVQPDCRKDVAQLGGCEAILRVMLLHTDDESLQVMALGALNVLSRNAIAKDTLEKKGASSIVADVMSLHIRNEELQLTGCGIICNLAIGQIVRSVTKIEISAILKSIISHPESCSLHKAACYALMSLASDVKNAELIRQHPRANEAINLAFQKHAYAVGDDISRLYDILIEDNMKQADQQL